MNPNILLTEKCNQSCNYCFAKQKMRRAEKEEMSLEDVRKIIYFLKKNSQEEIRLMGGEPTLHPQFKEIVDFILSQGLKIRLFTNGLFSPELTDWLNKKGIFIKYMINLTTPAFLLETSERKRLIENNLKILKKNAEIIAAITIDNLDFKDEPIINFLKKIEIKFVRLGIANVPIDSNWLKWEQYKDFGLIVTSFINKLRKISVTKINFNCGFTPCMFTQKQIIDFQEAGIKINGWGCDGKKGAFDVSTDLSIFPCFILENFKAKNLFDFKNLKTAKKFLENLVNYSIFNLSLFVLEHCKNCSYYKTKCPGPCFGNFAINPGDKEPFKNFQNTFYFKFIYNLLYLFRNHL